LHFFSSTVLSGKMRGSPSIEEEPLFIQADLLVLIFGKAVTVASNFILLTPFTRIAV
jgi:uncharacterized membrane protein